MSSKAISNTQGLGANYILKSYQIKYAYSVIITQWGRGNRNQCGCNAKIIQFVHFATRDWA